MSIHRAIHVFKILDIAQQKDIIKILPVLKTANLLNELPPDDGTAFLSECLLQPLWLFLPMKLRKSWYYPSLFL
ncbi:hypothetical protein [Hydrotalea sp.]|uniref:magnesium transporter MgtE N-terminal domain-containing protein n=1 Tax=Hydrotalea sp. TaxID=2881279 RepID=UPI00262BB037|nr:hypothetical protein [Hydrotalea sp.]